MKRSGQIYYLGDTLHQNGVMEQIGGVGGGGGGEDATDNYQASVLDNLVDGSVMPRALTWRTLEEDHGWERDLVFSFEHVEGEAYMRHASGAVKFT